MFFAQVALAEQIVPTAQPELTPVAAQAVSPAKKDFKSFLSDWREPSQDQSTPGAFSMAKGLLLVLGVFFIGVYFFKRFNGVTATGQKRRMRVLERIPISSKAALVLVEVGGQEVLVSVGSDRVSVIGDLACGDACCSTAGGMDDNTRNPPLVDDRQA